jgi:hypothetical protein
MNNAPLLKTLEHIVEDNESFDADIVELIFKKIQPDISTINYKSHYYSSHMMIDSSLWARVSFESAIKDEFNNIDTWKVLIEKYSPDSIFNDKSTVSYRNHDEFNNNFFPIQASASALNLALRGSRVFSKINTKLLTENEEILILIQNLQSSQEDFSYSMIKDNIPYCEYLVDSLIRHRDKMTTTFELKEGVLLNKILESSTLKQVVANIDPAKLLDLISETDLRVIYKKASLQDNAKNNPKMLNNLLPLATPDKWLNAYRNKKPYFNILNFFDNKFFLATGKNIIKRNPDKVKSYTRTGNIDKRGTRKETNTGYYSVKEEMIEEFKYLMPALKEQRIENNSIIQWYRALIRAEIVDLLKLSAQVISIPSKDSPDIDLKEYEKLQQDLRTSKWNANLERSIPYYEIYAEGSIQKLAETIDANLKESPKLPKVKI